MRLGWLYTRREPAFRHRYIGLEAAAVGAKLGMHVTLSEMAPRILQRVACRETSDFFRALHRSNGVEVLESTGLDRLLGDGRVSGALLPNNDRLEVDFVVVGIGIEPRMQLAVDAGLSIDNGIVTDALGRTSAPWAAAECASFPHVWLSAKDNDRVVWSLLRSNITSRFIHTSSRAWSHAQL